MMKTRRKTRASAADADGDSGEAAHVLPVVLPGDINEDLLSNMLPETNLSALTPEDVLGLYRAILATSSDLDTAERERDEARAALDRKEVELDQALQDREVSSKDLESSVESLNEQLENVKQERARLVQEKSAFQTQIATLSSSQSSSSSEVEIFKRRVDDTDREKRELVSIVSRLKDESLQRDEEIQTLRTNLKGARQEHQSLETQLRELRSSETSTKFKIDSLSQQVQLTQTEFERSNTELSAKTDEFSKYRRTKHAEVATLQASLDTLSQSHASTEASYKALQSAHTAQTHQLTQALSKVQELTGQLAEQEARYSNEASSLKRLVSMMEEREKQAKEIVENIEQQWDTVGEKAERREAELKEATERERIGREEAEKRLERLEGVLERIGKGELPIPGSTPSTPLRTPGPSNSAMEVLASLSPTIALASKNQRSGKTFTEVYADYVRLQEEFAKKSVEYDHMDRTLTSVLAQIEERAPILSQQRVEYERLQVEASQLGSQLAQALSERESVAKFAEEQSQKLTKSTHENNFLLKQLEDLGRQVQSLLRDISRRDDPTIPSDEDLEAVVPASDSQTLISNNLVLFKSIPELQHQNQRLLTIVRDLSQKLESDERDYREAMEKEQAEAVKEAHDAMLELAAQLERQKKSNDTLVHAYVKERDTLKSMLARAERAAPLQITAGNSVSDTTDSDLAKELAEIQSQFEVYKTETNFDSGRLRDELSSAQKELNQVGAALAKANAKVEYLTDRHRMNEEQFRIHNLEIDELSKRNTQLHDQNVRFDIECGRLSDEFQVASGRIEQYRNDIANLRAEKKIWESVQSRLIEENRSLAMERSHLSDLMSNVQKMHNDLERSGENDRRRLESQLLMLEGQTQDLRTQVTQERDSVRHLTLQKELEMKELQTRLDKKAEEFSKNREALVEAQTSKKHLEEKVEDLGRHLKGNEEKLSVYERRPSSIGAVPAVDQDASREQQLESEVAELRSAVKMLELDLATAKANRNQYQEISQGAEAALVGLNSTFEEYKTSAENQIACHESECKALKERLDQVVAEVESIRVQYSEAQKSFEMERTAWINDKKTLEDTIVDLSTSEKYSESDRSSKEQELRNLEDRAKVAEERYSNEIISHAESMKAIEALKKDLGTSQSSSREHQTAAETARSSLASSEKSWNLQKEALNKELFDLNTRCQDLSRQNSVLHQHLESVSAQATRIRQAADAPVDQGAEEPVDDADNRISELRSVVNYLRKEKGIVDLQLEMSKRENEVLKSQIDRVSQNLQETRTTLAEEREKAMQNSTSAAQHAELVERINQLNILRESNATLRAECESASKKSRELEAKLKQLSEQLEPAKEKARAAEAELEAVRVQMQRVEEESRRWQERNSQLLSKYDRADPAEVQNLKDEIAQIKVELTTSQDQLKEKESEMTSKIETLENNLKSQKDQASKNLNAFRSKLGEMNNQKSTMTDEKKQMEAKVASLEQEIAVLQASQKPETSVSTPAQSEELQKQAALIANLRSDLAKLLAEKESWKSSSVATEPSSVAENWESEKTHLIQAHNEALDKVKIALEKSQEDAKNARFQSDKFQTRIKDLMKARESNESNMTAQQEKRHAEELKALEEKLTSKHEADTKVRIEAEVQEALKAQQPQPIPANPEDGQAAVSAAISDYEQKVQARHVEEIASAVERGRMEQATKAKIKDAQLVKAQKRVKDLEAVIIGAGMPLPAVTPAVAVQSAPKQAAVVPTVPQTPVASSSQPVASSSQPKPIPNNTNVGSGNAASLPRKPNAPSATGVTRGVAPRGRGLMLGRGAAPIRTAPVKTTVPPVTTDTAGVSIMGAASKRPREEGSAASEDTSLAKRLKPAEPGNVTTPPIRRQGLPS